MKHRIATVLLTLPLLAPTLAHAERWKETLSQSCVVATAIGGEKGTDRKLDELRDSFNQAVLDFFAQELQAQGISIHTGLISVLEDDRQRAMLRQMAVLAKNGCKWYIEMSFYVDRNSDGVAWIKVNEMSTGKNATTGRPFVTVGDVKYKDEARSPMNIDKGQDFIFSKEAENLAKKFLSAERL